MLRPTRLYLNQKASGIRNKSLVVLILLLFFSFRQQPKENGKDIIRMMHQRYADKWYHFLRFDQTTQFYKNDTLNGSQTWYGAVLFPDKFRMDYGKPDGRNADIYAEDSVWEFRRGRLLRTRTNDEDPAFLSGGLYFYSIDETLEKLSRQGFDLEKFHRSKWKGRPVFVLGADQDEDKTNQLWIDQERLYLVRLIAFAENLREEIVLEDQRPLGGGWHESKSSAYINGKLEQVELYSDLLADGPMDKTIFDPSLLGLKGKP
jgi:hypothetical protein